MNLSKIEEVFDPKKVPDNINIIGCGSVGSTIAELLARYGLTDFTLWDMDTVEEKNIVNQMFFNHHIGMSKVDAVEDILSQINPGIKKTIIKKPNGWNGEKVRGHVFLAVDSIELRQRFMQENKYNPNIIDVFDIRTGLYDAQCWSAAWRNRKQVDNLIKSMNFTHEEAMSETPVSACGVVQGLAPTVRMICCLAVTNFINYATEGKLKPLVMANPYCFNENAVTAL